MAANHPQRLRVTACSPMCKQWVDNWEVLQQSDAMSSDTAEDLKNAMHTEDSFSGTVTEISDSCGRTKSTIARATSRSLLKAVSQDSRTRTRQQQQQGSHDSVDPAACSRRYRSEQHLLPAAPSRRHGGFWCDVHERALQGAQVIAASDERCERRGRPTTGRLMDRPRGNALLSPRSHHARPHDNGTAARTEWAL